MNDAPPSASPDPQPGRKRWFRCGRTALTAKKRTDGELFYFIRNGVRNTGMPGWQLPDQQIWQLVAFVRQLPVTAATEEAAAKAGRGPAAGSAHYVGSASCRECHED